MKSSHDAPEVSETAQVVATLMPALDRRVVDDLRRLLALTLAAPSAAERREARLGLLIELVSDGSGHVISYERYEAERASRGTGWPAASSLIRAYGSWLTAVKAAMDMHFKGGPGRVPSSTHHRRFHGASTRDEVIWGLRQCKATVGAWPTPWEWEMWAALQRRLWREQSAHADPASRGPRLPSLKQISRLFGTFDRAVEVAAADELLGP